MLIVNGDALRDAELIPGQTCSHFGNPLELCSEGEDCVTSVAHDRPCGDGPLLDLYRIRWGKVTGYGAELTLTLNELLMLNQQIVKAIAEGLADYGKSLPKPKEEEEEKEEEESLEDRVHRLFTSTPSEDTTN